MTKFITSTLIFLFLTFNLIAQSGSIKGLLQEENKNPVTFANIAVYNTSDNNLVKVEITDESGVFHIKNLPKGDFYLAATFVGYSDLKKENIQLGENQALDLGVIIFQKASVELQEATVTASRVMVETKPDRTIFNVEGTINSVGSDAISLLRKAPGVTVDNNDNINVMGRTGVLLYIDGKRLPLTGDDLSNYLQNLPAEQIDRIDIITNPGARYEAEGNAGIIDIRLKKDKNHGANGTINTTYIQGRYPKSNLGGSGNYRNKKFNVFGNLSSGLGEGFNEIEFESYQNGLLLSETNDFKFEWKYADVRLGVDYFINEKNTIGILVGGNKGDTRIDLVNRFIIRDQETPNIVDSTLLADGYTDRKRNQQTYNINYQFDNRKGKTINVDLDYGNYNNDTYRFQPNQYFDAAGSLLTEVVNTFQTPTNIDIYTFKIDFEDNLWGGRLGYGSKISRVVSDNTFLFFDKIGDVETRNDRNSNLFDYKENVFAGYLSYQRPINQQWTFMAGVRAEQTDAVGDLQAFLPELQQAPLDLNYLNWFPNVGLTFQVNPKNVLSWNYGRRINRPDYNVLNPFNNQLSQLSYERGNPFLNPEIVNNIEMGYTHAFRYNFKLAYSRTDNQITRLIGPDENDDRASFISWENLATQEVVSFNFSAPVTINKWWDGYFNFSASHLDNQADYGDGATVDVQAFTYSIYQQQTFKLPKGFRGEISGYFSGPGIWGGVFEYEESWSLNLGLQKKFLNDQLNVKLSANDIFYQSGWNGFSRFNGLYSIGGGNHDSRRFSINLSYRFGNQKVKSRKRKTGLEDEGKRVGSGNQG